MKIFNIKTEKNQTYILIIIFYIIGFLCDKFGSTNVGVEVISYIAHTCFIIFGSAIAIMWHNDNTRLLKSAKIHLSFLTIGTIVSFITWFDRMYPTFGFTLAFLAVIVILFIIDLFKIGFAYYDDDWN